MAEQAVEQALTIDNQDGVAWITLQRPERMNAVNATLRRQLADAVRQVSRDAAVRCVVVTGEGKAFCSGADVREFAERTATDSGTAAAEYTAILTGLRQMPKPTIAAMNGVAAGIGASIAMACDIRYAAPEAAFVEAFVKIGLTVDGGVSWLLPRFIGRGRALEMFYTGHPLTAAEAERFGLVNRILAAAELRQGVTELARAIADGPTQAIAAMKRSVNFADSAGFEEALEFEFHLQGVQMAGPDFREGATAFVEKRKPSWAREA